MDNEYVSPDIAVIGSLSELTQKFPNKTGGQPDIYSSVVPIVGSIVPQK